MGSARPDKGDLAPRDHRRVHGHLQLSDRWLSRSPVLRPPHNHGRDRRDPGGGPIHCDHHSQYRPISWIDRRIHRLSGRRLPFFLHGRPTNHRDRNSGSRGSGARFHQRSPRGLRGRSGDHRDSWHIGGVSNRDGPLCRGRRHHRRHAARLGPRVQPNLTVLGRGVPFHAHLRDHHRCRPVLPVVSGKGSRREEALCAWVESRRRIAGRAPHSRG